MKKALTGVLTLSLILGGVFAAEPVANVNVAEFGGKASVKWGFDLDTQKSGFQNETEVFLKLNLFNAGSRSTTGEGVWGELAIKTEGDTFGKFMDKDNDSNMSTGGGGIIAGSPYFKVKVDKAILHFGDMFYVGIKSDKVTVGDVKMQQAIQSGDPDDFWDGAYWSGTLKKPATNAETSPKLGVVAEQGIVVGFAMNNLIGLDLDVRSAPILNPDKTVNTYWSNNYAMRAAVWTKAVAGLEAKIAGSFAFFDVTENFAGVAGAEVPVTYKPIALSANIGYKLALNDTYYIKPQAAYSQLMAVKNEAGGITTTFNNGANIVAGVLFGWGPEADIKADVPYLDNDNSRKVTPGVSIQTGFNVGRSLTAEGPGVDVVIKTDTYIPLSLAFYSGELVPNLTAAAFVDMPTLIGIDGSADANGVTAAIAAKDVSFAAVFGAAYAIKLDPVTVTPKLGVLFANNAYLQYTTLQNPLFKADAAKGSLDYAGDDNAFNLKVACDVGGLITNTTLTVEYASWNLLNTSTAANTRKAGVFSFKAKIAF